MSVELNEENRNLQHPMVNRRSCSFCRTAGHNILTCNNNALNNFKAICVNHITNLNNINYIEISFRNFLLTEALYYSYLVKAFAIRYCGATTRNNINICIEKIIDYFKPVIQYRKNLLILINSQNVSNEEMLEESQSLPTLPSEEENASNSEVSLEPESNTFDILENINNNAPITWSLVFIEMILSIHESRLLNRKFNIKTNYCENNDLSKKYECGICYDEYENKNNIKLNCGHEFCKDCIKKTLQNEKKLNPCCAFCRTEITNLNIYEESVKDEFKDLIN